MHQVGLAAPSYLQRLESIHGWTRALELDFSALHGARHLQRFGPAAQGRVVRYAQLQPEQADDGADQALGLAQRQAEHRAQGQPGQNSER